MTPEPEQTTPAATVVADQDPAKLKEEKPDAKQVTQPEGSPARISPESAIIQRLSNQREALRNENKVLRAEITAINEKIDLLLSKQAAQPGNEDIAGKLTILTEKRDKIVTDLDKETADNEFVQHCIEVSDDVIARLDRMLAPYGVDLSNFNDPIVKALQATHDRIYLSGSTNYTDLLEQAGEIKAKIIEAKQPDPAKLKEEGAKEVRENMKKAGAVNVEVPGNSGAQVVLSDHQRRLKALENFGKPAS